LACPYFVPRGIVNDGSWFHPSRLPLGAGWSGHCCASGIETTPSDSVLHELCNLGNATACAHLPLERAWDAIRFSVANRSSHQITLWYVCELAHAPVEHGKLSFDCAEGRWLNPHADARVQRLAACYLETYRSRQSEGPRIGDGVAAS
jgi:hypothetical protein